MNIHEYQAKAVLSEFGVPISKGVPVLKAADAEAAAKQLPGPVWVVKARSTPAAAARASSRKPPPATRAACASPIDRRGRRVCQADAGRDARHHADRPAGKQVNRLYIEDGADIDKELYLSLLVDRETGRVAFVVSTEGGMNIEDVAHDTPRRSSPSPSIPRPAS